MVDLSLFAAGLQYKKKKRAEEQKGMDQAGGKQQIADASIGEGSL